MQEMKAFWLPSQTADHRNKLEKPDLETVCPASGKKLRLKDLIPVRFTSVPEGSSGRHMDPITHDTFSNSMQLVVLRPTGTLQDSVALEHALYQHIGSTCESRSEGCNASHLPGCRMRHNLLEDPEMNNLLNQSHTWVGSVSISSCNMGQDAAEI